MRNIVLAVTLLLIALCKPYKETCMNKVDTILLLHLGLLCHFVSAENGFENERILAITFILMITFPLLCFILFLILKSSRLQNIFKRVYQKCKSCVGGRNEELEFDFSSSDNSLSIRLIEPIALGDNNCYGTVNSSTY